VTKERYVCLFDLSGYVSDYTVRKADLTITVKPAHAVTSIKQSPVLKGHLFLGLS
jgi:hypothetical protein